MAPFSLTLLFSATLFFHISDATGRHIIPIHARRHTAGVARSRRSPGFPLTNVIDLQYFVDINLGGEDFSVQIDTGSADLWVNPVNDQVANSRATGAGTTLNYAAGSVAGEIKTVDTSFAGFNVLGQSYLEVPAAQNNVGSSGFLGLAPNSNSNIQGVLNSRDGLGLLDRIFLEDPTIPNFFTILMGRVLDLNEPFQGVMTVATVLDGFEAISDQALISLDPIAKHYLFLADEDSIIAPDGSLVQLTTSVNDPRNPNPNRLTMSLDTGFSFSHVPRVVADSFYGGIEGAEFMDVDGIGQTWTVPCTTEVNIMFSFRGQMIPIHPLDATYDPVLFGMEVTNSQGEAVCIGTFQPLSFDPQGEFDIILGMSFIRNVYMSINMGSLVAGSGDEVTRGAPFVQFLAMTDPTEAHEHFLDTRINSSTGNGDETDGITTDTDSTDDSPDSDSEKDNGDNSSYHVSTTLIFLTFFSIYVLC